MGSVDLLITTTGTAFGNQRKIDRTQNGVLWSFHNYDGTGAAFSQYAAYSTDGGTTWTLSPTRVPNGSGSSAINYTRNGSSFVDLDDYAHVVFKDGDNGYIYYVRGTPNAGRTAYTWSSPLPLASGAMFDYPDIIAHREGSGWAAHVVYSRVQTGSNCTLMYNRINISSAGALALTNADPGTNITGYDAVQIHRFPSIDFNHTGDGKTVAGGTPHLYVGWSAGGTGAGYGIRFRKATYSAGSWTWGTEREIDSTRYSTETYASTCVFDGTRVVISGAATNGSTYTAIVHDRDAADPATGGITLRYFAGGSNASPEFYAGSSTYDAAGNIYIFGGGRTSTQGNQQIYYHKWTRANPGTLGSKTVFDSTGNNFAAVSARRGSQGGAIDYVYTDGATSPYTVTSGRIVLSQNPAATTPLTPADNATWDSSTDQTVTFKPNDPDGDAASSVRVRYRPAGTSVPYAYLTSSTPVPAGGTASVTVPANTWPGAIEYASQSTDPSGAEGAWSPTRVVTGIPAALAALTGGAGGTHAGALALYSQTQAERAMRALGLV